MSGPRETPTVWRARPFCRSCGLCCRNTEMILTPSDVERIAGLGYDVRYFAVKVGGFLRLRNVAGHCVFYDPGTGLCRIYRYRPIGCSLYPIVFDLDRGDVHVDPECPLGHEVGEDDLRRARRVFKAVLRELGLE